MKKYNALFPKEGWAELLKLFIFILPHKKLRFIDILYNDSGALSWSICKMVTGHKQSWGYPENGNSTPRSG